MPRTYENVILLLLFILALLENGVAQNGPPPFLQPIEIKPTPTPLVKKTNIATPSSINNGRSSIENSSNTVDVPTFSSLDISFPGKTGILVETLDGKVIREVNADTPLNPASNVKIATAYAILKSFGPDYRFPTYVFTDGQIDSSNGVLLGNLYVTGRDPMFHFQHAVSIAETLNKLGIREVRGDLIVSDKFSIAYVSSAQSSANILHSTLDANRRSATATQAWLDHLYYLGRNNSPSTPSVYITGRAHVAEVPRNASLLMIHESAPLREIVKFMMCFSHNFVAERLGDVLGGAYVVASIVQRDTGLGANEFYIQTSSGLGINRVTPRAMMKLLRVFRSELSRYGMTFADVMPVAGIDPGTLQHRFNDIYSVGSVVGKTGTLGNTDGGVSSLTGEIQTRMGGKLLFVIFNQRGSVARFRRLQDAYIHAVQNELGGPANLGYSSMGMLQRLAKTQIILPKDLSLGNSSLMGN